MKWQHRLAFGALGLAVATVGCSEEDTTPGPTTTRTAQGGSGQGGSAQGGSAQGGSAQGGSAQGGSAQGGSAQGGGAQGGGAQGGAAAAPMDVSLTGWQMWANCQHVVQPDPIHGFFGASYDNTSGSAPATATVTSAKITMASGSNGLEWTFDVTPTSEGPVTAGTSATQSHNKVDSTGVGTGTNAPCNYCANSDTWTLEVQWDVEGVTVTDTIGPESTYCVH